MGSLIIFLLSLERGVLPLVQKDFARMVEQAEFPPYIELRYTGTPD